MNRPAVVLGLSAAACGYGLATHVVPRLSDHRGFHLVAHDVGRAASLTQRPRHTLVVVVDGLRADHARATGAAQRLAAAGVCALTRVGLPSISRPVYTVISSGVEQERTGVRNNDDTTPAPVDSIWDSARRAGLVVEGRSELAWWRELFPRGFDRYTVGRSNDDLFAAPLTADLTLIHPVYVDDASHDHGARSDDNRAAVARADRELSRALDAMDLTQDLVMLTADHGHRDRGGHGGPSDEVLHVLSCAAGRGVRHDGSALRADTRDLAPTLAVLLGIDLPRHACASHDPTPLVTAAADPAALGRAYVGARIDEIPRVRGVFAAKLRALVGPANDPWGALRVRAQRGQRLRGAAALAIGFALSFAVKLSREPSRRSSLAWSAAVTLLFVAAYRALSGGLDASSLNLRPTFIRNAFGASVIALGVGAAAHVAMRGDRSGLRARLSRTTALVAALNVAHIAAFGWPLGYPLPSSVLYFAPFLLGSLLAMCGLALGLVGAAEASETTP